MHPPPSIPMYTSYGSSICLIHIVQVNEWFQIGTNSFLECNTIASCDKCPISPCTSPSQPFLLLWLTFKVRFPHYHIALTGLPCLNGSSTFLHSMWLFGCCCCDMCTSHCGCCSFADPCICCSIFSLVNSTDSSGSNSQQPQHTTHRVTDRLNMSTKSSSNIFSCLSMSDKMTGRNCYYSLSSNTTIT